MKNKISRFCILNVSLVLMSCVTGPKDPGRTFTEKLNGDNYQSNNSIVAVPVVERKPVQRKFTGKVFCGEGLNQTPSNHSLAEIWQDQKVVASTSTGTDGKYSLSAPIDPSAKYQIKVKANCGRSSKSFSKEITDLSSEENFN